MPTATYAGHDEGFLTDPSQWTEEMALHFASSEGIGELTPRHWQVISFMRAQYQAKGTGPTVRVLGKTSPPSATSDCTWPPSAPCPGCPV